jgi:hypothetical protein
VLVRIGITQDHGCVTELYPSLVSKTLEAPINRTNDCARKLIDFRGKITVKMAAMAPFRRKLAPDV